MKYLLPLFLLLSGTSFANDFCQRAVNDINTAYQSYENNDDYEKHDLLLERLHSVMTKKLSDNDSRHCTWEHLDDDIHINYSPDKHLMTMDWEIEQGGTMRIYEGIFQYRYDNQIATANFADGDGYVLEIGQMTLGKKVVYFVVSWTAGYTSLHGQNLSLYTLDNGKFVRAKLIKTKEGLTHSVGFAYNPFLLPKNGIHSKQLIHINPNKQEFSIPVVIEDKDNPNGKVTNRTINYRFNGRQFVYSK